MIIAHAKLVQKIQNTFFLHQEKNPQTKQAYLKFKHSK